MADPSTEPVPQARSAEAAPSAAEPSTAIPSPEASRRGRRPRRRWLVLLLGLLAIVAVAAVEVPQWLFPAPTQTIWQTITAGIQNDSVPKQTALEAFAYVYRVNIPGVTVPSGIEGGDEPTSGSGVMRWVKANWDGLTADQQAVINRYDTAGPSDQVFSVSPAPTASPSPTPTASPSPSPSPSPTPSPSPETSPSAPASPSTQASSASPAPSASAAASASASPAALRQPTVRFASADNPGGGQLMAAPKAPSTLGQAMWAEVLNDIAHIGPRLGMSVIPAGFPEANITLTLSPMSGGNTLFLTEGLDKWITFGGKPVSGPYYTPCNITAYKEAWQNEAMTTGGGVSPRLHVLITHEVIHCYQNVVWGSTATAKAIPPWITEGTAIYLAADDTGVAEDSLPSDWKDGYMTAETPLTNRNYDAIGYYSLLAHLGRKMWDLMLPAWQAAAKSSQRSDAFIAVLNGDASDVRDAWAANYLRQNAWGDPWIMYGFQIPDLAQVKQHPAQAQPDPGWVGSLQSRSNTVLSVGSSSGEVVTIATDGLASVRDGSGNSSVAFQNQSFCVVGDCTCPSGTLLAGQNMATQALLLPFVAAFNAPEGGSTYSIIGSKLADLCGRQPTPQPKKMNGPCGSVACPNSNGDPHIVTINNYRYDFQAAGEFTLLRSPDGSVDIQSRQEPYPSAALPNTISTNTAIAAKVGSHRVGVYATGTGLVAHVDGKIVDPGGGPMNLSGGGKISTYPKGFEIDFPDGTTMWVLSVGQWGINAQIRPSAGLRADGVGLLGSITPGGLGVPALPNGTRLPAASDNAHARSIVYGQFADAWRLTDSTTLFDYDPGKNTETYTIRPYPTNTVVASVRDLSPGQAAAGTAACSDVTDPALHDDCVYDVGVTGDSGFAQGYTYLQGFYDNGPTVVVPPSSSSPTAPLAAATPASGAISGNVFTVTQGTTIGGFAIGANDTVYLSVQTGDNKYSLIAFDPKAGKVLTQVDEPALTPVHFAGGAVWLPGLVTANDNNCSVTRVDPATLAQITTVAVPCSAFGSAPDMASDGDALWYVDATKVDLTTNLGAVLRRIDPTTNAPGTSVALPHPGLSLTDSHGALFLYDTNKNYWRLATGSTSLDAFGKIQGFSFAPGGTGLWVGLSDGKTAEYFTGPGAAAATLQTGGDLVAGDEKAVYVEIPANDAKTGAFENQLWRYPLDGSAPIEIATAPVLDGGPLAYFGDPLPISNGDGVLKLWVKPSGATPTPTVLLQWAPVH